MKLIFLFLVLVSINAIANDELKSIYLAFESDYMSNDSVKYSKWLTEEYEIVQTLHVPGMGSDSRKVSGRQMVGFMENMDQPNSMPRSTLENTNLRLTEDKGFCATSSTVAKTKVSGKDYEEKEIREVCFIKIKSSFKAAKHKIDVHYREM